MQSPKATRVGIRYSDTKQIDGRTFYNLNSRYIYEDTGRGIVFIDDTSHILFNYNWQIGDTIQMPDGLGGMAMCSLDAIALVSVNGYINKEFFFKAGPNAFYFTSFHILEGVGSYLFNPLFPRSLDLIDKASYPSDSVSAMICMANNGSHPFLTWGVNWAQFNCTTPFVYIRSIIQDNLVSICPQPANEYVYISFPAATSGMLQLHNTIGQIIYTQQFTNRETMEITNQGWQGLYVYHIKTTEREYTGKLLFR